MASPSITISGAREIAKAFKDLEPKLAKKVIRQAIRRGLKVIQADAEARAPILTGAGRDSIRVRTSKGPRGSRRATIALAVLAGQARGPTWYMQLQEFGWDHEGGEHIEGRHFMRDAMRSNEESVKQQVAADILAGIEREANGAAK